MLHNDRKSRHRRIKKQRRYGRLAATSQFLDTEGYDAGISSRTNLTAVRVRCHPPRAITISGGSSMYLRLNNEPTPYHALNRLVLLKALPRSTADHPIPETVSRTPQSTSQWGVTSLFGVSGSKDFPASRCVASAYSFLSLLTTVQQEYYNTYLFSIFSVAWLDSVEAHCQGRD